MQLLCINDVVMSIDPEYRAFTIGKKYQGYKTKLKHEYDFIRVIRTINDHGERHIIKHLDNDSLDEFFKVNFMVVK